MLDDQSRICCVSFVAIYFFYIVNAPVVSCPVLNRILLYRRPRTTIRGRTCVESVGISKGFNCGTLRLETSGYPTRTPSLGPSRSVG